MPIPDQSDPDGLHGVPAAYGLTPLINRLRTGYLVHFVDSGGTHIPTIIGNVDTTRNPVEITVQQLVAGRVTTLCNIPYNDSSKPPYSWHFPSDG